MKITFKWSMTTLLLAGTLVIAACGGGGGNSNSASMCGSNSDTYICQVYNVVNNLTSESSDPILTDNIATTSSDDADPTTEI